MTDRRPEPLVPPEVDMGANDFFPFYFDRLRKSKWWRRASDVARSRNVMMWGEAYKATPAGSLEDDDDELAEAAGYGLNVDAFLAHKAEIMKPWVLCSDGRWYHPTVCEVVLETWGRTSERRKAERERKADYRKRTRTHTPEQVDAPAFGCPTGQPAVSRVTAPSVPPEIGSQDKTDTKDTVASAPLLATVVGGKKSAAEELWKADAEFVAFWDASTPESRRRSSLGKAWTEWVKRRSARAPGQALAAYRAYLTQDPDVKRTGGPGVHIWLKDKLETWATTTVAAPQDWTPERWAMAVQIFREAGRWSEGLGPTPDAPGCRAPQSVLTAAGYGLGVIPGGGTASGGAKSDSWSPGAKSEL